MQYIYRLKNLENNHVWGSFETADIAFDEIAFDHVIVIREELQEHEDVGSTIERLSKENAQLKAQLNFSDDQRKMNLVSAQMHYEALKKVREERDLLEQKLEAAREALRCNHGN